MCGIIAYTGTNNAAKILLDGLTRLEYRGYDSSGIAVIESGKTCKMRSTGKLNNLKEKVDTDFGKTSTVGIGHTRWATHGRPSFENAHPHTSGIITLVHNGIIENYLQLRDRLKKEGFIFESETDTEVIAHLILKHYKDNLLQAVQDATKKLKGSYALAVISEKEPDTVVLSRNDSPLVIGAGKGENLVASDIPAILNYTRNFIFLEDGESAVITPDKIDVFDMQRNRVNRILKQIDWNPVMIEKAGQKHFMQKEIFEQSRAIIDTIRGKYSLEDGSIFLNELAHMENFFKTVDRIIIVACGTSWHAGLIGKYYLENSGNIPVEVDIASEFRYRKLNIGANTLIIAISQSGETADTLAAIKICKSKHSKIISICNVVGSTITRISNGVLYTHAGPEIGVASTKAFSTQIVTLFLFSLYLGYIRGAISRKDIIKHLKELIKIPENIEIVLKENKYIEKIAKKYKDFSHFIFIGRHINYPVALEGALKLKEISYIHAEGYPAGEIKHGPIALINPEIPTFAIATKSRLYDKIISNIQEIKARDGNIIAIATGGNKALTKVCDNVISVPDTTEELSVLLNSVVLQLFAYHCANMLGFDVDQPRNLAKSVTVE